MATPENKLAFEGGWVYDPAPESTDHISLRKRYGLFIGGDFVAPQSGRYFDSVNPALIPAETGDGAADVAKPFYSRAHER